MRLWLFDRSGPYSSEKFDINKEPERFIRVIAGYALMTDTELGLNTFIKRDETGKYIVARDVRIFLEDKPIASTKAIVCRGTTCYRGMRRESTEWEYVIKFAWPSDKRQREGDLLKLAKERGVKGIAEWFHHEEIIIDGSVDTIAHFRERLKFGAPKKFSGKSSWVDDSTESNRAYSRTRSVTGRSNNSAARLADLEINTSSTSISSGQKRKKEAFADGSGGIKRSRSGDGRTGNRDLNTTDIHSIQETEADSLAGCESETYGNRIHCCLVTSPAGRPLHSYQSVTELLEALRDAIVGDKSLLEDGKMLHRDISENNIIITKPITGRELKGCLIDMDLGKELNSVPSGASHRTGTMQFMSIEVLRGNGHTYRHDLESFFYVFIWMCIRYGHKNVANVEETAAPSSKLNKRKVKLTRMSRLRGWYTGTYADIADIKRGHMDKNGFEDIITEFALEFEEQKQLARELRNILFPIKDGAIFIGTFRDHDIMYDGMINAFNRAIDRMGKEEQAIA